MRASNVSLLFVVGVSTSLSTAMLCEGSAMAVHRGQIVYCNAMRRRSHRALKDVSTALVGACFPFPSLSLAFYELNGQSISLSKFTKGEPTVKSAALSFFFFVLLGMMLGSSQ